MLTVGYIIVGLFAGFFSGLVGLGGGVIMVPALVYFYKISQHEAQGTSLAVLALPVTLAGAYTYYMKGHVNPFMAGMICIGFVFGGPVGAYLANTVDANSLKRVFAIAMILIGIRMLMSK